MRKIPVVSSDEKLNEVVRLECARFGSEFAPVFFKDRDEVIEFLKYELPEMKIFYFSDKEADCRGILKEIQEDPWLHYGGIVAIHDDQDEKEALEAMRDANIIAVLRAREFMAGLPRLLKILRQNKQILFQRGIQQHLLKTISGAFVMDNDPLDITTYANLVTNYLYNANLIGRDEKEKLHVALLELLINAIEHGNCRIGFDEKTAWLERNGDIMELIREKNRDPAVRARKVYFSYTITPERSRFDIRDEGEGFDWRARLSSGDGVVEPGLHGMGMRMANLYVRELAYNDKGNAVSFEVEHRRGESNSIPKIFEQAAEERFADGEYVCREGEESDFLYYIVSGTLYVYSKGKLVSSLSPDDMFMGEMSFLLSNRRSATVVAKGPSVLIKISKQDFVNLIKENPHYGIFLARLLAQRLARLNARTARLNTEYLKLKALCGPDGQGCGPQA
ncbi:MAG TPA: cyclic nucleotide-binding domain-containing protein, partial [Spirochaetales bacterium]|nr:cyclic nucleotide-binding domain-containing protein [Spirochaetales bacterium]